MNFIVVVIFNILFALHKLENLSILEKTVNSNVWLYYWFSIFNDPPPQKKKKTESLNYKHLCACAHLYVFSFNLIPYKEPDLKFAINMLMICFIYTDSCFSTLD